MDEKRISLHPLERFADDAVLHCHTEKQAQFDNDKLEACLKQCVIELYSLKTKIVYCSEGKRKITYPSTQFDFPGCIFWTQESQARDGSLFAGFSPTLSDKAKKIL